ncbi:uncharacterized protein SAPINGB_P003727 [Magnusiomyces paraingens]|uniref:Mif2/CENP-C cupin domain-containing protein n=1 Tax=Magnusiomyces paraingens TaxID=2606893 RepID=A0A5E8BQX2_9ASCO|nr:uncharacterized protein SAPINGB_P003727 [Saprochaete ingens]VVT53743.1 unnamed protein product [Saprochaete ingens]
MKPKHHRNSSHVNDKNQLGTIGRKGGTVLPDGIRRDETGMELMEDYYDSPSNDKQKSLASAQKDVGPSKNKTETRHNHAARIFSTPTATYSKKSLNDSNKSTKSFNSMYRRATTGPLVSSPANRQKNSFNEVISATQSTLAARLKDSPTVLSDKDMFSHSVDDVSMDLTNNRLKSPRSESLAGKSKSSFVNSSPIRNGQLQDTSFLQVSTEATKKIQNEYILSPTSNGKKMASSSVKPRLSTRMKSLNLAQSQNPTKSAPSLQHKRNEERNELNSAKSHDPLKKATESIKAKKIAQRTNSIVEEENDGLPLPVSRTGPKQGGELLFAYTSEEEEENSPTEDLPKRKQSYASQKGRRKIENKKIVSEAEKSTLGSLQAQKNIPSTQSIRDDYSDDDFENEIEVEKVEPRKFQSNAKELSVSQSKKNTLNNAKRGGSSRRKMLATNPDTAVSQKTDDNIDTEIEFEEIEEEEEVIYEKEPLPVSSIISKNLRNKEDKDSGLKPESTLESESESESDLFSPPPPKPKAQTGKAGAQKQSTKRINASNSFVSENSASKSQKSATKHTATVTTSSTNSSTKPSAKPAAKPAAKSAAKSAVQPAVQPTSKSATKLATIQKPKSVPSGKAIKAKNIRVDLNESAPGLRRSGRVRVAPLQFWKNERILYTMKQDEEAHTKVPGIKEVFHREDEDSSDELTHSKKRKTTKRKARNNTLEETDPVIQRAVKRAKNLVKENSVSGLVHDYNSDGNITTERTEKMVLAWGNHISNNQFSSIPGSTHKLLIMYPNYNGTGTAAGMIVFDPNGEKPFKPSRETDYFFFVISGVVEANISENVISVGAGGSFRVPMGNYYSIKNLTEKEAKLFMVQAKDTAFSNALKEARKTDGTGNDEEEEEEEEDEE